jgi:hypothetical protein
MEVMALLMLKEEQEVGVVVLVKLGVMLWLQTKQEMVEMAYLTQFQVSLNITVEVEVVPQEALLILQTLVMEV